MFEEIEFEDYQICFNKTREWPDTSKKLITGIFISIFSIIGFLFNLFIISIIGNNFQQFIKGSSIYILLLNCCVSHCCYLPSHFIVSLPGIFSFEPIYSNTLMLWLSSPHTLGYYLVLFSNFSIAIDRFLMLFIEKRHSKNAKIIAYFFVFSVWFFSIFLTVAFAMGECHKRFNQWTMTFNYGCNSLSCGKAFIFSLTYDNFLLYFGQCLCFIMFFIYFLCFLKLIKLYSKRLSSQRNVKGQIKIIIQFFTIFLAQWASSSFLVVLPYISGIGMLTTLLSNSAGLINAIANATLLLLFNRNLRKIAQGSVAQVAARSIKTIQVKQKTTVISLQKSLFASRTP